MDNESKTFKKVCPECWKPMELRNLGYINARCWVCEDCEYVVDTQSGEVSRLKDVEVNDA